MRMRTITERVELDALLEEMRASGTALYVRVSDGPGADRRAVCSRNWASGQPEAGLSVNRVASWRSLTEYVWLLIGRPRARVWLLSGEECGQGSDGEPLLRPGSWRPIAEVGRDLLHDLVREAIREDNLREAERKSVRYPDGAVFEVWGERFRRLAPGVVERVE